MQVKRGVRPAREEVTAMQAFQNERRDDGQTMSEYAIVLAVITPAIVAALALLSDRFASGLESVASLLP